MTSSYTLITGATGGIGLALARLAAADHRSLILVARNAHTLAQVSQELIERYGVRIKTYALDLSVIENCDRLFKATEQDGLEVDILMNNAGFGDHCCFESSDPERQMEMLRLNVLALTRLTRLYISPMVERGAGRILNVASVAAFSAGPYMAVYYATKAYVLSFSEALKIELKGTGVSITTLCPGPTATNFGKNAHLHNSHIFTFAPPADAVKVARLGYHRMLLGHAHAYAGRITQLTAFFSRLVPRMWAARIAGRINGRPS